MTNPFQAQPQAPAQPAPQPSAPAPNPFETAAPAAPAQSANTNTDPFDAPAPPKARAPRMRDLYGRLVVLIPKRLEEGVRSNFRDNNGQPVLQDRLTTDIVVLDGGTLHYGGRPEETPPVPHTEVADVPVRFEDVYNSNKAIISQCREALRKRLAGQGNGMVLGRIGKGEAKGGNNAPWILLEPTEADRQLARQWWATQAQAQF